MAGPNAADWLTAIGTVGTLAATVALFWWDRRQRQKREYRAQAVLVSGWADSVVANDPVRALHVVNISDEPVYNVNIFLEDENKRDVVDKEAIAAQPITQRAGMKNKRFLSMLPPKQQVTWEIKREKPADPCPRTVPRVGLLFNDRNSTRWFRDWDGKVAPAAVGEYDPLLHRANKPADDITPPKRKPIGLSSPVSGCPRRQRYTGKWDPITLGITRPGKGQGPGKVDVTVSDWRGWTAGHVA